MTVAPGDDFLTQEQGGLANLHRLREVDLALPEGGEIGSLDAEKVGHLGGGDAALALTPLRHLDGNPLREMPPRPRVLPLPAPPHRILLPLDGLVLQDEVVPRQLVALRTCLALGKVLSLAANPALRFASLAASSLELLG